jgi:hypothetical protein
MQMLADFVAAGFRQAITGPKKLRKTSTYGTASAVPYMACVLDGFSRRGTLFATCGWK